MIKLPRALGRIPMTTVVAGALAVLALWSLLGATLRTIPQYNGDLLASLAVCVLGTLVANTVASLIVRAPARFGSSVTTGLLLYFLMWPSATAHDLGAAALAAVVAVLAKFLLVPFGRRLVNPAAFGALVLGVTGLGVPGWWVATEWMLIPVVVLGLLVLWRAGGWDTALVTFVLYLVLTVQWIMSTNNSGLGESLKTALVSYPILFFCLFMVTEPLTSGVSRWHRLIVGALTGLIASRPLNLEVFGHGFTLGPEFALVAGNVIATVLAFVAAGVDGRGSGAGGRLTVASVSQLSPSLVEVALTPRKPVSYKAGQALEFSVPGGGGTRGNRRVFSLVGTSHEELRVIFRKPTRASKFKLRLAASPGLRVRSEGIRGDFVLPSGQTPLLMVARGVGITPFMAQIEEIVASGVRRDVVLVHVLSSSEDAALTERIRSQLGAERLEAAGVRIMVSDGSSVDGETDAVSLLKACPDAQQRRAEVSGSPSFVERARKVLRQAGVEHVQTDSFAGY